MTTCAEKPAGTLCVTANCLVGCCVYGTCVVPVADPSNAEEVKKCIIPCKTLGGDTYCQTTHGTGKCTTFECTDNYGFPADLGPFNDGCVAVTPISDDSCNNSVDDDCKKEICSPIAATPFTCVVVNEPQGKDCQVSVAGGPSTNGCCLDGACVTDDNVCAYVSLTHSLARSALCMHSRTHSPSPSCHRWHLA